MDAWWSLYKAASIVPRLHCPQPSLAFLLSHCLVPFRFATDHRKLCVLLTFCSNSARRFILFIFYLEFPQRHPTSVLGHNCLLSDYTLFMRPNRCSFEPQMLLSSRFCSWIIQFDCQLDAVKGLSSKILSQNWMFWRFWKFESFVKRIVEWSFTYWFCKTCSLQPSSQILQIAADNEPCHTHSCNILAQCRTGGLACGSLNGRSLAASGIVEGRTESVELMYDLKRRP